MTDVMSNPILERLRWIDDKLDAVVGEVREIRLRTTADEVQMGALNQSFDRLYDRVGRIEKRLDLVEG